MKLTPVALLFLCIACSTEQGKPHFVKLIYDLRWEQDSTDFEKWRSKNITGRVSLNYNCIDSLKVNNWSWAHCFYEDETYRVLGECRGEFGGSVIFIRKNTPESAFYLPCVCPRMVEKREDGFYVTETLAHMVGFGSIIKVKDPQELIQVDLTVPLKDEDFIGLDRFEMYKSRSFQPVTLVDTIGCTFSLFFGFDKNNYLVFSERNSTYLGEVKEGKVQVLDTLLRFKRWHTSETPGEIVDGIYHSRYMREYETNGKQIYSSGDIYVKRDTIVIGYSEN